MIGAAAGAAYPGTGQGDGGRTGCETCGVHLREYEPGAGVAQACVCRTAGLCAVRRRACAGAGLGARCCGACAGHQVYTRGHVRAGSQAPQVQVQVRVRWDNITRKIDARVDRNDPFSPQFLSQPIKDYTITQTFSGGYRVYRGVYRIPGIVSHVCVFCDGQKRVKTGARREPRQRNRTSKLRSKSNDSGSNSDSLAASP